MLSCYEMLHSVSPSPQPHDSPVAAEPCHRTEKVNRFRAWCPVWLITLPQAPPELDYGVRFKLIEGFSLGPSTELGIFPPPFLSSAGRKPAYPLPSSIELPPTIPIPPPLAAFPWGCQVAMPIRFPWLLRRAAAFP